MANSNGSIDEIIGQEAIKGVDITTQKMESLYKVFVQNIAIINTMNVALGDVKKIDELEKAITTIQQKTIGLTKVTKEYTQTQAAAAVERSREIAQMKGIAKETSDNIGAYERLNATHKRLEKQAKDVGVQLGIESEQFRKLSAEATKYRDSLAKVEQAVGNNSRITGDYRQKVYDAKTQLFGLTQVLREVPAFTYSATTGVLAMSNNLPILADNFINVASSVKQVKNEMGQMVNDPKGGLVGTTGALKIFGASIFSFGNIFAIALGLFTIFSKQIFEFISGTKEASKEVNALNKAIGDQTGRFKTLTRQLGDHNLTKEAHIRAAKELQALYPTALKNYSAEEIGAGKAAHAIANISRALVAVAKARAAQEDINKMASEQYANDKKRYELNLKLIQAQREESALLGAVRATEGSPKQNAIINQANRATNEVISLTSQILQLDKANSDLNRSMNLTAESISKFSDATDAAGLNLDGSDKGGAKTPKSVKSTEPDLQTKSMEQLKIMRLNLQQFNGQISEDTKKAVEKNIKDLMDLTKANPIKFTWTWADSLEAFAEQAVIELTKVQEIVSETGEAISTFASIQTDRELADLERKSKALKEYYDSELQFIEQSGLSSAKQEKAKQKLKAETEAKQKQIDRDRITALRKQASIDKAVNIANIIISTALAISKQLVATPLPYGAVFVASQVALGAAQLARAIATPLPQYAKGRRGGKAEFAETNEQGAELHITKDGKAYIPNEGKRGITYLDEGTSVLPADITKQLVSSTIIQIANNQAIKTNDLQRAILEKTDREIIEIIGLRKDLREKNLSATFNNYTGFEAWKNTHIR